MLGVISCFCLVLLIVKSFQNPNLSALGPLENLSEDNSILIGRADIEDI